MKILSRDYFGHIPYKIVLPNYLKELVVYTVSGSLVILRPKQKILIKNETTGFTIKTGVAPFFIDKNEFFRIKDYLKPVK